MPFQKGQSGNPRGKKPGTRNKNNAIIQGFCKYLIDGNYEKFETELNTLKGQDYVKAFLELAKLAHGITPRGEIAANEALIEILYKKIKR